MGQEEVIEFLKKHPEEEFLARDLSRQIEISSRTLFRILRDLLTAHDEELNFRYLTGEELSKFNLRKKTKVYFFRF